MVSSSLTKNRLRLAFKMKALLCFAHNNVLRNSELHVQSIHSISHKPLFVMLCGYIEIYPIFIVRQIYKLQRMTMKITSTLSIGFIADSFNLFSVECGLFQLF